MITRYGLDTALALIVFSLILIAAGFYFVNLWAKIPFFAVGLFLLSFTLNFFRDPDRITPRIENGIIAPADGKIILITPVVDEEFLQGQATQVSIFMSPLNVHVNRIPVSGEVTFFRYIKGEYLVAFEEKASEKNERTLIGIDNGRWKILFKQIAGFIARRIVCPLKVGDTVRVGERFGMIKFGSRVDVLMPSETEVRVKIGEHVVAGETILGVVPQRVLIP